MQIITELRYFYVKKRVLKMSQLFLRYLNILNITPKNLKINRTMTEKVRFHKASYDIPVTLQNNVLFLPIRISYTYFFYFNVFEFISFHPCLCMNFSLYNVIQAYLKDVLGLLSFLLLCINDYDELVFI